MNVLITVSLLSLADLNSFLEYLVFHCGMSFNKRSCDDNHSSKAKAHLSKPFEIIISFEKTLIENSLSFYSGNS